MPDTIAMVQSPPLLAEREGKPALADHVAAQALKISERQYRRLFEAARDGILILDSEQGRITDANPFMTELLGYTHEELLGKEVWEIGLLKDKESSQRAFRQLKQDNYIRYENLPLENRRGEQRQVEFVSNVYREDGHMVIQCNIRDITERKRAEAELADAAVTQGRQSAALAVLEERTRMAQEIHDTLAQGFTGITTQLEAAEAALIKVSEPVSPERRSGDQAQLEKVRVRIGKARDLARESLAEARVAVVALRSPPLEGAPLSESVAHFLTEQALDTPIRTRYLLEGIPYALPDSVEHCLLRIAQEAIVNAVKHAQAKVIDVELCFEPEQVRLTVRDDGRGFDFALPAVGRFGLIGMQERAEKAQGKLAITSHSGTGTTIELTISLSHQALKDGSRNRN